MRERICAKNRHTRLIRSGAASADAATPRSPVRRRHSHGVPSPLSSPGSARGHPKGAKRGRGRRPSALTARRLTTMWGGRQGEPDSCLSHPTGRGGIRDPPTPTHLTLPTWMQNRASSRPITRPASNPPPSAALLQRPPLPRIARSAPPHRRLLRPRTPTRPTSRRAGPRLSARSGGPSRPCDASEGSRTRRRNSRSSAPASGWRRSGR
jgi:hypothetical protein